MSEKQHNPSDNSAAVDGCWQMVSYQLANGTRHQLTGMMVLASGFWTAIYYIMEDGAPQRGSSEAGRYDVDGDRLVFRHRFFLSLGASFAGVPYPTNEMAARSPDTEKVEECRFDRDGDRLSIHFPSANVIELRREN